MNIKVGDLIFLVKDETSMHSEHIVKVEEYDYKTNVVRSSKVYTVYKMPQQNGPISYTLVPGFFTISNKAKDKTSIVNSEFVNEYWINLSNFDVVGHIINEDVLKAIREQESNIIVPDINTSKGILGKNG